MFYIKLNVSYLKAYKYLKKDNSCSLKNVWYILI